MQSLPTRVGPAKTYAKGGYLGPFSLLSAVRHSALPRVLPFAAFACAYTIVLKVWVTCSVWPSYCGNGDPVNEVRDDLLLIVHPYAYQPIMLSSGFGLVFRLNQSLARYWEARSAAQTMASKWADGIMMALAFDEETDPIVAHGHNGAAFARAIVHLGSLLHATALHSLRGDSTLATFEARGPSPLAGGERDGSVPRVKIAPCFECHWRATVRNEEFALRNKIHVLGGLLPAECEKLAARAERVHVVLAWMVRLLVQRRKAGGLAHDGPIVSRIYQVLSDGNLGFLAALKVVDTPFPFAYAQFNSIICFVNLAIFPVIVADKIASLPLAAAFAFCGISLLFGLNEVARDLEDPFTTELGVWLGANRLHAPVMQAHFDERLLAFGGVGTVTPWPETLQSCFGPFLEKALGQPADANDGDPPSGTTAGITTPEGGAADSLAGLASVSAGVGSVSSSMHYPAVDAV